MRGKIIWVASACAHTSLRECRVLAYACEWRVLEWRAFVLMRKAPRVESTHTWSSIHANGALLASALHSRVELRACVQAPITQVPSAHECKHPHMQSSICTSGGRLCLHVKLHSWAEIARVRNSICAKGTLRASTLYVCEWSFTCKRKCSSEWSFVSGRPLCSHTKLHSHERRRFVQMELHAQVPSTHINRPSRARAHHSCKWSFVRAHARTLAHCTAKFKTDCGLVVGYRPWGGDPVLNPLSRDNIINSILQFFFSWNTAKKKLVLFNFLRKRLHV